jgi:hypothetical protein
MRRILIGVLAFALCMFVWTIIRTRDSTQMMPEPRPPNVEKQQFLLPHFHPRPRDKIDLEV